MGNPFHLTQEEILFILEKIKDKPFGYSDILPLGKLQAKLSMQLQVAAKLGYYSEEIPIEEVKEL